MNVFPPEKMDSPSHHIKDSLHKEHQPFQVSDSSGKFSEFILSYRSKVSIFFSYCDTALVPFPHARHAGQAKSFDF
jgi:hypothetical protein